MIRELDESDAAAVLEIYQRGLDGGEASFETRAPDWAGWTRKYLPFCRLVSEHQGQVCGWAALAPVSARECYRGVAEVSIYVCDRQRGKGIDQPSHVLARLDRPQKEDVPLRQPLSLPECLDLCAW